MPQPRYSDLRRFCEIDGWEEVTKGRRAPDHTRYRKILDDGRILRTKVSHGRGSIEDPSLWKRIWRDQLGLENEGQFWEALSTRKPVARGPSRPGPPAGPSKPGWLVNSLIFVVGLSDEEVSAMSEEDAHRRWLKAARRGGGRGEPRLGAEVEGAQVGDAGSSCGAGSAAPPLVAGATTRRARPC